MIEEWRRHDNSVRPHSSLNNMTPEHFCRQYGKNLNREVTAEGVETQEKLERLQSINCDRAQGYMFSKPMAPGDAGDMIRTAVLECGLH